MLLTHDAYRERRVAPTTHGGKESACCVDLYGIPIIPVCSIDGKINGYTLSSVNTRAAHFAAVTKSALQTDDRGMCHQSVKKPVKDR